MLSFSSKMLATHIFNHLNNNLFSIILGKFYSEKEVGYYNQANKWNYMGHSLINGMLNGIAQPVLAQVSNDKNRQLRVFRKMVQFSAFVSFPAMFGLSLIAPELISITITNKWIPSAHILQLLCIGGAFIPIINLYSNLIISKGKSNIYMWNTITLGIIQLIIIFLIHSHGLYTMIISYLFINITWILIWHYFIYKEITYKLSSLLYDIMPFFCTATISTVASHYLTNTISNIYLLFICKIAITCILYISIIWLSGSQTFKECISYIKHNQL
jgi:O-antigen/teichoic acid export membrane protein